MGAVPLHWLAVLAGGAGRAGCAACRSGDRSSGTSGTSGKRRMAAAAGEARRVLVYGGRGALGSRCVQAFRARDWVSPRAGRRGCAWRGGLGGGQRRWGLGCRGLPVHPGRPVCRKLGLPVHPPHRWMLEGAHTSLHVCLLLPPRARPPRPWVRPRLKAGGGGCPWVSAGGGPGRPA